MLQVVYPHEETIKATALAIFEFWQRHYLQLQSGIHTWHEVMIAAAPYAYNFNFVTWKKEDRARDLDDPADWDFDYPPQTTLVKWLTKAEKKSRLGLEDVHAITRKQSMKPIDAAKILDDPITGQEIMEQQMTLNYERTVTVKSGGILYLSSGT